MKQDASTSISPAHRLAIYLGNLFEHYDTALFSMIAPFIAPLFFPEQDLIVAIILTYAIIPLGIISRPIGALFFGYIGDRYSRQRALFFTLIGMAVATGLISILPTYNQAGLLSPLLLCVARILQNFFAAGEIAGGAIYLLENSTEQDHNLQSSYYGASTVAGSLLASFGVTLLSYFQIIDFGWRILYVLGMITALFGFYLRHSPSNFSLSSSNKVITPQPMHRLRNILWDNRRAFFSIIIISGFYYANYSIALVLMNGFLPLISNISKTTIMSLNTLLIVLDLGLLPLFGYLANKFSRRYFMASAAICAAITAIPLFSILEGASLLIIIAVRSCFVIIGIWFSASFHAWAQSQVSQEHRYTVVSFGYAIGTQLLGAPATAIALWTYHTTGLVSSAAWYWTLLALISIPVMLYSFASERTEAASL